LFLSCPPPLVSFHELSEVTGAEVVGEAVDALVRF
jgi:hypothetical protein